MGSQQSRDIGDDDDDDDRQCQPCFFFNSPVARRNGASGKKKGSNNRDPLGSPLPDTPVAVKKRKQAAANAISNNQKDNPIFSSKYGGLEKEVSTSTTASSSNANNNSNANRKNGGTAANGSRKNPTKDTLALLEEQENNNMYAAEVYEGKVRKTIS